MSRRPLPRARGSVDRPLLLRAFDVAGILQHGKRQHRFILPALPEAPGRDEIRPGARVAHPAPYLDSYCSAERWAANPRGMSEVWCWWTRDDRAGADFLLPCKPGDTFWVREAWAPVPDGHALRNVYEADGGETPVYGWNGALSMPRSVARLSLAVLNVRVERLQEISQADAVREGAYAIGDPAGFVMPGSASESAGYGHLTPAHAFAVAWDERHARGAWVENPHVAVIDFEPLDLKGSSDEDPRTAARAADPA